MVKKVNLHPYNALISLNSARFSTFVRQKLVPFHHPMPHPPMAPLPRLPLAILTALPAPTQTSWSRRTGNVWRCGCWRWKSSRFSTGTWRFSRRNFRYVWFIYCSPSSCEWRPFLMKDFRLVIRTTFVCKTLHGYWLVFIDIDEVLKIGSQAFYLLSSAHNLTLMILPTFSLLILFFNDSRHLSSTFSSFHVLEMMLGGILIHIITNNSRITVLDETKSVKPAWEI